MAKNEFQYGGWNCYTLECGTIMTFISPETTALNCLVFEKIAFFYILATDRLTNRHTNRWTALSSSRCREWRLNKGKQPLRLSRGRCITITIPHNTTCLEKR